MKKLKNLNSIQKLLFILLFLAILFNFLFSLNQIYTYDYSIFKRKLEDNHYNDSEKFCSSASNELKKYYTTGDSSKLDLDDITINEYHEYKNYDNYKKVEDIIQKYDIYKVNEEQEYQSNNDYNSIYSELYITINFCLVISFISSVVYILCLFNACCKCCFCRRRCKENNCIKPCFVLFYFSIIIIILTSLFNIIIFIKISKGFVNTGCSYLKFYENILYGEKKQTNIKWIGIEGVTNILKNLFL